MGTRKGNVKGGDQVDLSTEFETKTIVNVLREKHLIQ